MPGVSPSGQAFELRVSAGLFRPWLLLIPMGPTSILIAWLRHRWVMRRALHSRLHVGSDWPLWLLLLALFVATVGQVWILLD